MVQVHRYYEEEESNFRRCSLRGHGYSISRERDLSSDAARGPYGGHPRHQQQQPTHDGRNGAQSPEQDSSTPITRRRIPVAVSLLAI